jgi:DNA-binding beta-propeller fold protein YncE
MANAPNPNFPTGRAGLIAIDKMGNKVFFLHPETFEILEVLGGFAPKVHELAISPDHTTAYAPIYGDGRHGSNPNPGHLIAVFDLTRRRHKGDFSVSPFLAPHGLRWGSAGQLYCVCEDSGVVAEMDGVTGEIRHVIEVGSTNAHRIEVLPDGSKLYTENEEDPFATVIDLASRRRLADIPAPNGLAGLGVSPDGRTIVLVDAKRPELIVVETATDAVVRTTRLTGHSQAAQIARFSPDGRYLVVTSNDAGIGTILTADLRTQYLVTLGKGPMDMAFHPDGRTALVGNQDDGTISVLDLDHASVSRTLCVGDGVESLAFY